MPWVFGQCLFDVQWSNPLWGVLEYDTTEKSHQILDRLQTTFAELEALRFTSDQLGLLGGSVRLRFRPWWHHALHWLHFQ